MRASNPVRTRKQTCTPAAKSLLVAYPTTFMESITLPDGMENLDTEAIPMPEKPYNQACVLQKVAFRLATDKATKPNTVAMLMRAWKDLQEQKRIMKMRPAPKPIDVPMPGRRKQKQAPASAPMFEDPTKPQS